MNEYDRLYRQAQRYKELYPKGTRILLLHMGNDPRPVEDDMRGTVIAVDDKLCFGLSDGFQQLLVGKAQILFLLIDEQQPVRIAACGNKAGNDRIVCVVLCGLVNDIDRFCALAVGKGHWLAPCQHCGKLQNQGAFAVTGVALQDRDLTIRNIRIP